MEDFDSLKREATKLERHLEDKVARYQQVCVCVLWGAGCVQIVRLLWYC